MIDLKLDEHDAIWSEQRARFAEGFFGIDEVIQAHVGIVGELGVRVEQSEKDKVVARGGSLHEGASIGEVGGDAPIIVGMLRVPTSSQSEDFGVDLNGIDGPAVIAQ